MDRLGGWSSSPAATLRLLRITTSTRRLRARPSGVVIGIDREGVGAADHRKALPVQLERAAEGFQHRDGAGAGKLPIALETDVVDGDGVGVSFELNGIGQSRR